MRRDLWTGLDTPCILVDETVVMRNIAAVQAHCDQAGLVFRPHIKTHKLARFGKAQMQAGAVGVNCQKIGEAEVMADADISNILITFNIIGPEKLARLTALAQRVEKLSVVADSLLTINGLSSAFADTGLTLDVLVECDTGGGRCGVQTPQGALDLARAINSAKGLNFKGLLTYPAIGGAHDAAQFMKSARALCAADGLSCEIISTGGSPDMWKAETHDVFTEYRAGTNIYNDRSLVSRGACDWDDCALSVVATVISTPTSGRAVIDAGSKSLTTDLFGQTGFGHVVGSMNTQITNLSEEHGVLHHGPEDSYQIGDTIRVIPNHVCVVSNLFDKAWIVDEAGNLTSQKIDARGLVR